MKTKMLLMSFLSVILAGCEKQSVENKDVVIPQLIVTDTNGYQYKLIKPQIISSNGVSDVSVWERINPFDLGNYYIPTKEWQQHTNEIPSFIYVDE